MVKSIDVTYPDGRKTFYPTLSAFCNEIGINTATFSNMIRNNRTKLSLKTKPLEHLNLTIYDGDNDDNTQKTYAFGGYAKTDYNRLHTCECGSTHYYRDRKRHMKSKLHGDWVETHRQI